jgi:uncharacterized protein (TIRG00374 family)
VRTAAIWAIKLVVSGGLLTWLLSRVDRGALWQQLRNASPAWLAAAIALYLVMLVVSSWRWQRLLVAQHVTVPFHRLFTSFLVASFFNNFLPSNIGGDVVRIRDTAEAAGSKTRAATIVLVDRAIGLMGLVFVAALGATLAVQAGDNEPFNPLWLWLGLAAGASAGFIALFSPSIVARLLKPLRVFHQEWVEERINRLIHSLEKFRQAPRALIACFLGSLVVQAVLVAFYAVLARAMHVQIPALHLAVLIPMSFVVQMLPVSVNGFGVREYIFGFYFAQLGLPRESAIALSFLGAALMMVFSISGAVALLVRGRSAVPSALPDQETSVQ